MRAGDLIQSRYELTGHLGTGGMADVWCATDRRLDRPVAVKLISLEHAEDPEFLVRFFTEAQSVARLSHHHVVKVLDFGELDGRPFLVSEYVSGGALTEVETPLMAERALEIVEQAALGAGAAHRIGIVHRDIKPANILLDEEGRPKLADFGIAASSGGERLTATGQAIGSPSYMSPEQISGRSASPASDVYSLGVVLYELLTGHRPFESDNLTAVAVAHVEQEAPPPSVFNDDVTDELDDLVLRCLDKDPENRFADGAALAAAIVSFDPQRASPAAAMLDAEMVEARRSTHRRILAWSLLASVVVGILTSGLLMFGPRGDTTSPATADPPVDRNERAQERRGPEPASESADSGAPSASEPVGTANGAGPGREDSGRRRNRGGSSGGSGSSSEPSEPAPVEPNEPEPEPPPEEEPAPEPTTAPTPAPTT